MQKWPRKGADLHSQVVGNYLPILPMRKVPFTALSPLYSCYQSPNLAFSNFKFFYWVSIIRTSSHLSFHTKRESRYISRCSAHWGDFPPPQSPRAFLSGIILPTWNLGLVSTGKTCFNTRPMVISPLLFSHFENAPKDRSYGEDVMAERRVQIPWGSKPLAHIIYLCNLDLP